MIKIENLNYKYKNGNTVLKGINLTIKKGEFICVVGKNGAGKSTLGKIISGLSKVSEGSVKIDDISTCDKLKFLDIRKKIGIVFQNPESQLIFNNVKDEIMFYLTNLGLDNKEERILNALKMVGMESFIDKEIYELSLGQKQRIAIAEILSASPEHIVFDEPTTMLDSEGKQEFHAIAQTIKEKGYTVIYITNLTEEILLSDRILILDNGKIVEEIETSNILNKIDVFDLYSIKLPPLVKLVSKLNEKGIKLKVENFEVDTIVNKITEVIYEKLD